MQNIVTRFLTLATLVAACNGFTSRRSSTATWGRSQVIQPYRQDNSKLFMATWSDARAVREYQDYLSSGKTGPDELPDVSSVIITANRDAPSALALALSSMSQRDDEIVEAYDPNIPNLLQQEGGCPIYVTLPATELVNFFLNMPAHLIERREDLVFFSGGPEYGNIEKVLQDFGLARDDLTQVLCTGFYNGYERPVDTSVRLGVSANEEEKWAGETCVCGKWAGSIKERLTNMDIRCRALYYRDWRRQMWERTIYDSVFNLVGAVRSEPTRLMDVALYYGEEVSDIVWEISTYLRGSKAITLTYGFEERLFAIGETSGDQMCQLTDEMYPFLYGHFEMAKKHAEYVSYAKYEIGLLPTVDVVPPAQTSENPIMKQGNFRADGVI